MTRIALCLLAFCLLLPGAARATTIGSDPDFVTGNDPIACPGGCTVAQAQLAGIEQSVPEDGVVTELRIKGTGGTAKLRQVSVDGAGNTTGGAVSAAVNLTGGTATLAMALPVKAGDYLGVELSPGAAIAADESFFDSNRIVGWLPALGAGQTRGLTLDTLGWAAYEATVERDADGDGLGDETKDSCVFCEQPPPATGGGTPPPPSTPAPAPAKPAPAPIKPAPVSQRAADPYADIRKAGPKVTFAPTVQRKGATVTVTVANPYAFAVSGKLAIKRGKKTVATKKLKLAANATKKVKLKVKGVPKKVKKLALAATLKGPVGKSAVTKASVRIGKASKPKTKTPATPQQPQQGGGDAQPPQQSGGVDGTYRGQSGGDAGWVMVIENGVIKTFYGKMGLTCAKSKNAENHGFTNSADDPPATVGPDGSFSWEATSGYGMTKLKFTGRVANGQVTGNAAVEYHPPVNGVDPVSGMPRFEFDSCFGGRDYTLVKE